MTTPSNMQEPHNESFEEVASQVIESTVWADVDTACSPKYRDDPEYPNLNTKAAKLIEERLSPILAAHEAEVHQTVTEAVMKVLVMNLSDAAFAAGQLEGMTGKEDVYWKRRMDTLQRRVDELRAKLSPTTEGKDE